MQLFDVIGKFEFDTLFNELCDIVPEIGRKRSEIKDVYDFLLSQTPVTSKKTIVYQLIEDDDSFDCFVGAEDRCFEGNWNVLLGKEVVIDEGVEISMLEIAINSLLCIMLIGYAPKRFLEFQEDLRTMLN